MNTAHEALAPARLDGDALPDALPILFSPAMVRAERAGLKTQTRRVIRPQPDEDGLTRQVDPFPGPWEDTSGRIYTCPYGTTLLWVRERMRVIELRGGSIRVRYEADGAESDWIDWPERLKGTPRVGHCLAYGGFREASRTLLKVWRVRVERVQDISEEDARAEGISCWVCGAPVLTSNEDDCACFRGGGARHSFEALWDSINGKRLGCSWEANPWVWVVDFVRFEPMREAA